MQLIETTGAIGFLKNQIIILAISEKTEIFCPAVFFAIVLSLLVYNTVTAIFYYLPAVLY